MVSLMPRPKSPEKKRHAVQVLFSDAESDVLARLLAHRSEELRDEGVVITAPMLIRWLITREAAARGLLEAPGSSRQKSAKPTAGKRTASKTTRKDS
jgi:hypothetical protein